MTNSKREIKKTDREAFSFADDLKKSAKKIAKNEKKWHP